MADIVRVADHLCRATAGAILTDFSLATVATRSTVTARWRSGGAPTARRARAGRGALLQQTAPLLFRDAHALAVQAERDLLRLLLYSLARREFWTGRPRRSAPRRSRAALAAGRGDHAEGGLTGQNSMHPCRTPVSPQCRLYYGIIVTNRAAECIHVPRQRLLPLWRPNGAAARPLRVCDVGSGQVGYDAGTITAVAWCVADPCSPRRGGICPPS